jgi:hypothetical protein
MSLPAVIEEIVGIIGHGKAMALIGEFGGQELRIPKTDGSDTWAALAEVIGEPAMKLLAAALGGGEPVYIALCHRALIADRNRRLIARYENLLRDDHSSRGAVSIIVREFRPISYRTVEKIVNSPLPEPSGVALQAQLF